MSKSASLPKQPFDLYDQGRAGALEEQQSATTAAWKQEVNQRLAAHRIRRGDPQDAAAQAPEDSPRAASKRAADAAARVAARYAKAPSYSELLAGEARAVVRAAGAAAEAARHAQAAAQAVLEGLESGPAHPAMWEHETQSVAAPAPQPPPAASRWLDEPPANTTAAGHTQTAAHAQQTPWAGAQPRWEESLPLPAPASSRDVWSEMRLHPPQESSRGNEFSGYAHGDEELFPYESANSSDVDSYDAMSRATVEPVQPIPANLIEFPRELVATRKSRPRLAEGPFYDASQDNAQLSIFEVDLELLDPPVCLPNSPRSAVAPPEWASIELEHPQVQPSEPAYGYPLPGHVDHCFIDDAVLRANHPVAESAASIAYGATLASVGSVQSAASSSPAYDIPARSRRVEAPDVRQAPQPRRPAQKVSPSAPARPAEAVVPAAELLVAPMSDRLLASVVDVALVTLAFLAAAVVVIASTNHPPAGRIALLAGACGWLLFGLLYQYLFFSYAEEGTPGMRYARIALCTFDDDNPSRELMRKRIPSMLLAALPAGIGFLWAIFDGDHLAWHDRMTRTYQRKY